MHPYRPLTTRAGSPVRRLGPALEGLVDIVGIGECLTSRDASFSLVVCTQVLSHVSTPPRIIGEIRRVLKPGAIFYLTTPAIFALMHDHHWSFARERRRVSLADLSAVEIVPEGGSIAGLFRTISVFFETFVRSDLAYRALRKAIYPVTNTVAH